MDRMGNRTRLFAAVALAAVACSVGSLRPASAQTGQNYDVKTINFDLWCQEQAHLAPDRCDKRSVEDEKSFEDYRASIERYEVPYLQARDNDLTFSRDVMHNDPVDNPVSQDPVAQSQTPSEQTQKPQP